MKKILILILIISCSTLSGCIIDKDSIEIFYDEIIILNIGDSYLLPEMIDNQFVSWKIDNQNIIEINNNQIIAIKEGYANVLALVDQDVIDTQTIVVREKVESINIKGKSNFQIGEKSKLEANIVPSSVNQEVIWNSSDPSVAQIDDDGFVIALAEGVTTITATSVLDPAVKESILIYVKMELENGLLDNNVLIETISEEKILDVSNYKGILSPLINEVSGSVIGVSSYRGLSKTIGSGIIYKRNIILNNNEILENVENISDIKDIKEFEYWVVTNRHIIENSQFVKIYYQGENEIPADLIQYDDKEDLAVLKFYSKIYFPVAKFAAEVETGDFVIAIGHSDGYEYFNSATFGIVSHPERYLATDTDNNNEIDWDAEYIQHDAPINEGNCGGPLMNLKGEIVGINTIKQSSLLENIDNIGFAIPSQLALSIVSLLEQGIRPQRATLGVTVISIKDILKNPGEYQIPSGLTYGFYIVRVNEGIAKQAGVIPGDILVEFNGKKLSYSYQLRAEINKFVIGSGEIVEIVVLRNINNSYQEKRLFITY